MFVGGRGPPRLPPFPTYTVPHLPACMCYFRGKEQKEYIFKALFIVFFTEKVWVDVGLPQTTHREGTGPSCHSRFDPQFLHP